MNSVEAMTRLVIMAEAAVKSYIDFEIEQGRENEEMPQAVWDVDVAAKVINAMLNTVLPIAKYRCFVEVDAEQPAKRGKVARAVHHEYTVCGVSMAAIQSGLSGLMIDETNVRIMLFHQKEAGAEMVTGFQGKTKTQSYRLWLKQLPAMEFPGETVQ